VSDQAALLEVESGQLDAMRGQLDEMRKTSEKQLEVLGLQAQELGESLDERKRDGEERRRAQASRVFMEEKHLDRDPRIPQATAYMETMAGRATAAPVVCVNLYNRSDLPIYDVRVSWHRGTAPAGDPDLRPNLMPGGALESYRPVPEGCRPDLFGAVVFFRDSSNVLWRRRPDGQLDEIPAGQEPPHTW
jgi:hypothetical protein